MSEEKPQGTNNNPIEEDDEDPPAIKIGIDKFVSIAGMTPQFIEIGPLGAAIGAAIGAIAAIGAAKNKSEDSNSENSDEDE